MSVDETFLEDFAKAAEVCGKVQIPDDLDIKLAKNIINFFITNGEDYSCLLECMEQYFSGVGKIVVSIKDFAGSLDKIFYVVKMEHESKKNFHEVLKATARRMEGIS